MSILTTGVIASHNQSMYILDSITSLANEVDELLVVDDFSTDGSRELLAKELPPNVKVLLSKKRAGVSESLNRGVQEAAGEVVFIQGGDDVCLPGRVQLQLESLDRNGTILSYSQPEIIGSNGALLSGEIAPEFQGFEPRNTESTVSRLIFDGNYICAPSCAFQKSDFIRLGGFNPNLLFLQDFDLWLTMALQGELIATSVPVIQYRKHEANLSREGSQDSGLKRARFDAEYAYSIQHAVSDMPADILRKVMNIRGLPVHEESEINRLSILASHHKPKVIEVGLNLLFWLQGQPELRSKLEAAGFGDPAVEMLVSRLINH